MGERYRVIKSVSDFSFNEEPREMIPKAETKKKKDEKRLSLEALGEERRLKNQMKKERMKRRRLKRIENMSEMSQTEKNDFIDQNVQVEDLEYPIFGFFYPLKRPHFDKTDDEIFDENLTIGQRAKIYKEYEYKKEKMNLVLDKFCSNLKTQDGRPVRLILIDDSKCFKEPKIKKETSKINIKIENEQNWEDRLKNRIREDRAQLDQLLFELKKEVEETNKQKQLLKEEKKLKKEKMKDKKLMIKLLKERIKDENRSKDCLEKKNVLLNNDEKMLVSGSKHILNIEPVKNMLFRMISRNNKLEEMSDQMEEECFQKMAQKIKRKEGKVNRKKLKICEIKEPRKSEVRISEEDWTKRKKERRKGEKSKRYNGRIMEIWREMIKKHVEKPQQEPEDDMVEIDLKDEKEPEKPILKRKFKTKLKLPPLRFGKNSNFIKTPSLNPLTAK